LNQNFDGGGRGAPPFPRQSVAEEAMTRQAETRSFRQSAKRSAGDGRRTSKAAGAAADQAGDASGAAAGDVADDLTSIAGDFIAQLKDAAIGVLDQEKARAADTVTGLAELMHRAARTLESESAAAAQLADHVGGRAEAWATGLRQRDWRDLVHDIEEFARRRPILYLAGSLTAGFVAAQLSSPRPTSECLTTPSRGPGANPSANDAAPGRRGEKVSDQDEASPREAKR
jgi:hypothetical protein